MSPVVSSLVNFTLASAVFTVAPGVDAALVLRSSVSGGHRLGLGAVCGIVLSTFLWGVAAAAGLCALLAVSPTAFMILKWAGALYLAWLGLQMIFRPNDALEGQPLTSGAPVDGSFLKGVRQGLGTDLLNPETGVFVVTFFPQFIPPGTNIVGFTMVLTLILMVEAIAFLGLLVFLTVPLGGFLAKGSVGRWIDRITGVVFLTFAFKLAMASFPK